MPPLCLREVVTCCAMWVLCLLISSHLMGKLILSIASTIVTYISQLQARHATYFVNKTNSGGIRTWLCMLA